MSPMKSILWKEVRQQRGLFLWASGLATFITATYCCLANDLLHWPMHQAREYLNFIAVTGFCLSVILALTLSSNTFASEREDRTDQYLSNMPLHVWQLLTGKVLVAGGFVAAFLALMIASLLLVALVFNIRTGPEGGLFLPDWIDHTPLWSAEFFLWGILFSMIVSRPLVAVVLAGIATLLSGLFLSSCEFPYDFSEHGTGSRSGDIVEQVDKPVMDPVWWRLMAVFLVAAFCILLSKLWFRSAAAVGKHGHPLSATLDWPIPVRKPVEGATLRKITGNGAGFGSFFWLGLRAGWPWMVLWALLSLAVGGMAAALGRPVYLVLSLPILGGLAGVFAFTPDRNLAGQAFLGIRAGRPSAYWLTNTGIWLVWILLVFSGVALLLSEYIFPGHLLDMPLLFGEIDIAFNESQPFPTGLAWVSGGGLIVSFFAGLVCSTLVSSRTRAAIAAIVLSCPVVTWYLLMLGFRMPLWLSVFPVVAAFVAGSWFGIHRWFDQRLGVKQVLGLTTGVVVTLAITAWLSVLYRFNEVPVCDIPLTEIPSGDNRPPNLERLEKIIVRLEAINTRAPTITLEVPWKKPTDDHTNEYINRGSGFQRLIDDVILVRSLRAQTVKFGVTVFDLDEQTLRATGIIGPEIALAKWVNTDLLIESIDQTLDQNKAWLDEVRLELENLSIAFEDIRRLQQSSARSPDWQQAHSLVNRLEWAIGCQRGQDEAVIAQLSWHHLLRTIREGDRTNIWPSLRTCLTLKALGGGHRHLSPSGWQSFGSETGFAIGLWLHFADPGPEEIVETIQFLNRYDRPEVLLPEPWIARYKGGKTKFSPAPLHARSEKFWEDRFDALLGVFKAGERERDSRLYDWSFALALASPLNVAALESDELAQFFQRHFVDLSSPISPERDPQPGLTAPVLKRFPRGAYLPQYWEMQSDAKAQFEKRARSELVMIQLALSAWSKKYGGIPESLDELVPEFIAELPTLNFERIGQAGGIQPKWELIRYPGNESSVTDGVTSLASTRWVVQLNKKHPYVPDRSHSPNVKPD